MKPSSILRKHPLALCLGTALALGPASTGFAGARDSLAKAPSSRAPWLPVLHGKRAAPAGSPVVTNCNDSGPGSLREAVSFAADADRVLLDGLTCSTITLTSGAIHISAQRLFLNGPGASELTIDGNGADRVFEHNSGVFASTYIYDLTIANGHANGNGGCLSSTGDIHLVDSVVRNCVATPATGEARGGAMYAVDEIYLRRAHVTSSTVVSADTFAKGGGVYAKEVDMQDSTVDANAADGPTRTFGGGVFAQRGDITSSTISDNAATNVGGVTLIGPGAGNVTNSTITGNSARDFIGGLYSHVNLTLQNSTIAFNCASRTQYSPTYVLGIGLQAYVIAPNLQSSIIAKNDFCLSQRPSAATDTAYDISLYGADPITGANNLIGPSPVSLPADTLSGDPLLSPLADNGGRTKTLALQAGSPAIDAGNNAASLRYDQRGAWIARVIGSNADIGAFELQSGGSTNTVTSCSDSGAGTLREAAASALSGDTIDLSGLSCGRITLTTGAIELAQPSLKILGPGAASLAIDGNQQGRVFDHTGFGTLAIDGVALENGYLQATPADGGCVRSYGNIVATDARFSGCNARTGDAYCRGGAVNGAGVSLTRSTVSGNSCGSSDNAFGGGVYATVEFTLEDTTISDNNATGGGGNTAFGGGAGIMTRGSGTITSSTISGNQADIFAGAYAYTAVIANSTISGNTAFQAVGGVGVGTASIFNSSIVLNRVQLDNLTYPAGLFARSRGELQSTIVFGNTLGSTAFDVGGAGGSFFGFNNLVGFSPVTLPPGTLHDDPLLGPLQNNGGPTATHALLAGSPAIDAGNNAAGLTNDQRGPGFARIAGASADIGAFETQAIADRLFADGFEEPL